MKIKISFLMLLFIIPTYGQFQSVWDQVPDDIKDMNAFKFCRPTPAVFCQAGLICRVEIQFLLTTVLD